MLFDDEYLDEASATRASPVAKAVRSDHAKAKDASKHAETACRCTASGRCSRTWPR